MTKLLYPKISVVLPIHEMENGAFFLWRLVDSLCKQTFKDWELVITKDGKMAENTNSGIKRARGEYIKIFYLDDYFTHKDSLGEMVFQLEESRRDWGIVGVNNNLDPHYTEDIETGNNKLGSPSALIFKNKHEDNLLFDERMSWLLDCDLYKRMYDKYGAPLTIPGNYITLGEGDHQMTHILTNEQKLAEHELIKNKYA